MSINVTEFNTNWSYDNKPITEFIGIELQVLFSSNFSYEDQEMTIFSLMNEEFNLQNLREKIEMHICEIVHQKFHSGDVYFRLCYKNSYGGISGTIGIDSPEICSLFGPDYFNSLIQKHNNDFMNPIMASIE